VPLRPWHRPEEGREEELRAEAEEASVDREAIVVHEALEAAVQREVAAQRAIGVVRSGRQRAFAVRIGVGVGHRAIQGGRACDPSELAARGV